MPLDQFTGLAFPIPLAAFRHPLDDRAKFRDVTPISLPHNRSPESLMQNYTIDAFWRPRLQETKSANQTDLRGWYTSIPEMPTFVEAPLSRSDNFGGEDDPDKSEIILVSAPGAVGKSTLARQIASLTGAVYLDLAEAEPVGSNTLSGGLVKAGILSDWQANAASLLIDGLDEARLKVTQEGFEAFLADVAYISRGRSTPTLLFGRTGAIQDAWLVLAEKLSPVSTNGTDLRL